MPAIAGAEMALERKKLVRRSWDGVRRGWAFMEERIARAISEWQDLSPAQVRYYKRHPLGYLRLYVLISLDLKHSLTRIQSAVGRASGTMWHRADTWRYKLLLFAARHGALASLIVLIAAIGASILAIPALEHVLERHFTSEAGLSALRTLFVTLGGALIGATAIAFSVVMFAVQINFARMPHGLFRRLSSDFRLLGGIRMRIVDHIAVSKAAADHDAFGIRDRLATPIAKMNVRANASPSQPWPDCIINMFGYDFRKGQPLLWSWAEVVPQIFRVLQFDGQLHPLLGEI
jgi:hypothetical protein